MAEVIGEFSQIFLTYKDVAEANPHWTQKMVEDYLAGKRELGSVVEFVNEEVAAIKVRLDAIELRLDLIEARLDAIEARLDYLEGLTVVTDVDVTTEGNTTIICTAPLTVTLADTPLDRDTVSIKAQSGDKIIIEGNGNTIDGQATLTIRTNKQTKIKTGLTMQYSSEADEWFLI